MFKDSVRQVSEDGPPLKRTRLRGPKLASKKECPSTSELVMSSSDNLNLTPDCIICNSAKRKRIKVKKSWTSEGLSDFEYVGWQNLQEIANQKQDERLLTRIRGKDFRTCKAKCHRSCIKDYYISNPMKWRSRNTENKDKQKRMEEAHAFAFSKVCEVIDKDILQDNNMIMLSDLISIYVSHLQETEFANPKYRGQKLKEKVLKLKKYSQNISFCPLGNSTPQFHGYIVYSSKVTIEEAIGYAYELGSSDKTTECANRLHSAIVETFKKSEDMKWPPSANDLENATAQIPSELEKFLNVLISKHETPVNPKVKRLVQSIGQDVCRAATNGEWKLPKHVLLCLTLRHLYRSKQLITLINKLGHCENYSFSLELETAIAKATQESSTLLSVQIIRSPQKASVFHSEFDNFDQLLNTITGKESIHTAHGIMLQDISGFPEDHGGVVVKISSVEKQKSRSLNFEASPLPECYIAVRKSPKMILNQKVYPGGVTAFHEDALTQLLWILARMDGSKTQQSVPGLTGFLSKIGTVPESLTSIDYYPVISNPITEYKTVQECMRFAECATQEVQQEYTIITFDLGVCMKAYPLIWSQPEKYSTHIILIGTFHLSCAFMKMLAKKMEGSGFSDILLEADLIGSGSIKGVLSGKHYDRALHCHKVIAEALERLLLLQYFSTHDDELPDESRKLLSDVVKGGSPDAIKLAMKDEGLLKYLNNILDYRESCKAGKLGQTAQFWISFMDHVRTLQTLIHAVKHSDFVLYAQCMFEMSGIFFSFNGHNYARYLTYFAMFLCNIESSHPGATLLLKNGAISVARSFIPGNRVDVDKTMEETFMRHAKSQGGSGTGLSGILTNPEAYQRWVRTTHARSKYVNSMLNMADMQQSSENDHRDLRPSEINRSEKHTESAIEAIQSFLNPFAVDNQDKLYILSSGQAATDDIAKDVLRADDVGNGDRDNFIENRLKHNTDFFEPIKRNKLKTLGDMHKKLIIKSPNNKICQYKQQGNIALHLFLKCQQLGIKLQIDELVKYPMTPVPYSIATADGFFCKTEKSKAFHHLVKDIEDSAEPPWEETLTIYDGNASFYSLKDVPSNFQLICQKVFDILSKRGDIVFSTDSYVSGSIKAMERARRGMGEKLLVKGEKTKKPVDWKSFLSNDDNKQQFISLLASQWSQNLYATKLQGRQVTIVCDGHAYLLSSADGQVTTRRELPPLQSSQEETDTRIILYCNYGRQQGYRYIRVKSPDSDVFFILLYYATTMRDVTILFDTGTGNKKRLIDVTAMSEELTESYAEALLALHAYCGCDSTSAFKGIGHLKPLKLLKKNAKYEKPLAKLGNSWTVSEDLMDELDAFTCAIYGRQNVKHVDELRYFKLNELGSRDQQVNPTKNVDLASVAPCRKSLEQHIRRVNYQVGIWKHSHLPDPDIPAPTENHGWHSVDGKLEPLWFNGEALPKSVIDISQSFETSYEEESDDDLHFGNEEYYDESDGDV